MAAKGLLIVRYNVLIGKLTKLTSAAVLSVGLMASAASAATILNLTGSRANLGNTETYSVDDITIDVTSVGGNIHRNSRGLGVTGRPNGNRLSSNDDTNESLTFTFSRSVSLLGSLIFEHRRGYETFSISVDGSNDLEYFRTMAPERSNTIVSFSELNLEGTTFTFTHHDGSGIRINELTVLVPVPLPAAMPMALLAFGGLFMIGRRRKKA